MATTITKHKRGFFGRMWQIAFWLFQLAMIGLVAINIASGSEVAVECAGEAACEAGAAVGVGLIAAVGWMVWMLGTLILGLLMLTTRGKTVTIEK